MIWPIAALIGGIILLLVSADKFVDGAAAVARRFGMSPLLIGMIVMGFGSSMPEMVISVLSAMEDSPGLALGNAFGSNITNIALILGVTAVISPVAVHSSVLLRELPLLAAITAIAALLVVPDAYLSRADGWVLIVMFLVIMCWTIQQNSLSPNDDLGQVVEHDLQTKGLLSTTRAAVYLIGGLILLVISSRILVWGGVEIATQLGISDLIIGLTIVAVGTSLPELAASIAAVRKNEHALAIGNVIGSNMFNTSIVIGMAGVISPTMIEPDLISRDFPVVMTLTLALFFLCFAFHGPNSGRINRKEGVLLLCAYVAYNISLVFSAINQTS
jgi:cation:H+ antiporter